VLDTHRLRVFRSVVASGSVQAAAANLGYTPSAVSQHVTALQLAEQADAILDRIGEAETVVADLRAGRTGALSLSYFASVGAAWMARVVRRLTGEFPGVRLDLALREWLPDDPAERSDVQIAVERPDFAAWPGFTAHHLLDDPYVVVLPEGHPLAGRDEIELAELATERWVDNDFARGWCRRNLIEACTAAGFRPPFHVEAHDYPTALAFVAAGIGITVLPELGAINLPAGTRAVPVVHPVPVRSILAVVRDAVAHTPPVLATCAELREIAGESLIRSSSSPLRAEPRPRATTRTAT
jgi:DNA-binding transcriptional LysR family regulator